MQRLQVNAGRVVTSCIYGEVLNYNSVYFSGVCGVIERETENMWWLDAGSFVA